MNVEDMFTQHWAFKEYFAACLLILSLLLQTAAIISTIRLIKSTKVYASWIFFLIGFIVWMVRRGIGAYEIFFDNVPIGFYGECFSFPLVFFFSMAAIRLNSVIKKIQHT